jgi:acyl dehydratase
MSLNYDYIMNYDFGTIRQSLTKRDAALYALSCGLGADPMDEQQLDFVDYDRAIKILPSMPVVLANRSGFMADAKTGIDFVQVVHGEQSVEIFAPLPTGVELTGRTKVTGIADKGAGRGAVMTMERDIFGPHDTLLARTTAGVFLRGNGGFGGSAGPAEPRPRVPETPPDITVTLPTRPEQALYYRFNGDDNPLHASPAFARAAGFPRPILHGLCTFGVITHALIKSLCGYDPAGLKSFGCRFSSPIFPGETIQTEIWKSGIFRARAVERDVTIVGHGFFTLS